MLRCASIHRLCQRAAVLALLLCAAPPSKAQPYAVEWLPFEEALATAARAGTKVLVFVEAPWCGWCKQMDREVFMDEDRMRAVRPLFVFTALDVADDTHTHRYQGRTLSEKDLARHLGAAATPTTLFLDADGRVLADLPGYVEPDTYVARLRYIGTGAYLRQSFEAFAGQPP